jgi:hypothetical protein
MTTMVSRIAPLTQPVEADGGAAAGVRGRAARPGRSFPGPDRAGREAPDLEVERAALAGRAPADRLVVARAGDERDPEGEALVDRAPEAGRAA